MGIEVDLFTNSVDIDFKINYSMHTLIFYFKEVQRVYKLGQANRQKMKRLKVWPVKMGMKKTGKAWKNHLWYLIKNSS